MKYFKQDFRINNTFLDFDAAINQVTSYCNDNNIELNRPIKNYKVIYSGESDFNLKTCSMKVKPGELDLLDFYKLCIRVCTAGKDSYGNYHSDWENEEQGYFMQTMLEEILAQNIFSYNAVDKEKAQKYIEATRKDFAEEISLLHRICLQLNIDSPIKLFQTRNTDNKLREDLIKKYKNMTGTDGYWNNIEQNLDSISMYKHSPINSSKTKANEQLEKTSNIIDNTIHATFSNSLRNSNHSSMSVSDYLDTLTKNRKYKYPDKEKESER